MSTPALPDLIARARALSASGRRSMLGITGAPGSGKSTLAAQLAAALGEAAAIVPMDGFHFANQELERLGRRNRKGAPDTFDAAGYIELLRRVRSRDAVVYAPEFRRDLDEAVAGAIRVPPEARLVVTEGNYLLVGGAWAPVRSLLDEVWYLDLEDVTRADRLVRRHVSSGMTRQAAIAWVHAVDEVNARIIERGRTTADLVVDVGP